MTGVRPLALTQGDPAGIGPEIALKAWMRRTAADLPPFVVLGDPAFFQRAAAALDLAVPVEAAETVGTGAIGRPMPTKDVRIVDADGRPVG